ncbi:MAG: TlpA family protein disulfide reductase [Opitutus sp.]|nr:TlpA family protein disulfide reductase [Opitutus sp.]
MKSHFLLALALLLSATSGPACAAAPDVTAEVNTIVREIQGKLQTGARTAEALAVEMKKFDELFAAHASEKTDDVARILYLKATLNAEIFDNVAEAVTLLKRLKAEFPASQLASRVDQAVSALELQQQFAVGKKFPDFAEVDLQGAPLSIAKYKGKVVLLDFWATWCGPCIAELPTVVEAYKKFHSKGFEIIGISLDKADAKEKLVAFTKEHEMPWVQYYDGKYWENKLVATYGIRSIPATFLLDGEGKIVGKDLRGPALEAAVAKALGI